MDEELKKGIRNHTIQILIGILIIFIFFDQKSWLRFIGLGGFLLAMINIIWFVVKSEIILYHLFPSESYREKNSEFKDKIWGHISMVFFFSGLIFLIVEIGNIENIIEESKFWKNYGLLGFAFSIFCLLILYKIQPSIFKESGRRYSVIFGFIIGLTFLTISTFSFINKYYAQTEITESIFIVNRKSNSGNNKEHWVFITLNNSEKKFEIKSEIWNKITVGENVLLKLQIGYLEYKFVNEITPTANTV